jgi:hypothetical protein
MDVGALSNNNIEFAWMIGGNPRGTPKFPPPHAQPFNLKRTSKIQATYSAI